VPAAGAGERTIRQRRQAPGRAARRSVQRALERHVGSAASRDQQARESRRRPNRRRPCARPAPHDGGEQMSEPWWISAIKGFVIINIVLLTFAYTTLLERKAL